MPHAFSVEIHCYLSEKIKLVREGKEAAIQKGDIDVERYFDGKLLELVNLRHYLTENFDLKTQKYY